MFFCYVCLGYSPRLPDTFTADTIPPTLTKWFIDSATKAIHFKFSEPVVIVNTTAFQITNSRTNIALRLMGNITYLSLNLEAVMTVSAVCAQHANGICTSAVPYLQYVGFAPTDELTLTVDESAAADMANIPNTINPIHSTRSLSASAPGTEF